MQRKQYKLNKGTEVEMYVIISQASERRSRATVDCLQRELKLER